MNELEKKKFTKRTILTGNKERIKQVLNRYWSLKFGKIDDKHNIHTKVPEKEVSFDEAKAILEG